MQVDAMRMGSSVGVGDAGEPAMSAAGVGLVLAVLDQRGVVVLVAEREPEAAVTLDVHAAAHRERPAVEPLDGGPAVGIDELGRCGPEAGADLRVDAAPRGR